VTSYITFHTTDYESTVSIAPRICSARCDAWNESL